MWLFGGPGPVRLAGVGAGPLARAVSGERTLAEVIDFAVAAGMEPEAAARIAHKWRASGHLVAVEADVDNRAPAKPDTVITVVHHDVEVVAATRFRAAWAAMEVPIDDDEYHLTVVLLADLLDTTAALAGLTGPVIAVAMHGEHVLISPVLKAGFGHTTGGGHAADGACAQCLVTRVGRRRQPEVIAAERLGLRLPPLAPVPACPACDPQGESVLSLHLSSWSPLAQRDPTPDHPSADHQPEADLGTSSSGAFQVVDPAKTWARFRHLISEVVGVVPYVKPTGPPELRVFSAGMNLAASDDLAMLRSRLRASAGGRGLTLTGARTGALAEALERDSLHARGNEPHVRARLGEIPDAIHPNRIQLFSHEQLHRQQQLSALGIADPLTSTGFHRVPLPFDVEAEHDWSAVTSLTTGNTAWVPSSLMWLGWPNTPPGYPRGDSNGAAAGNTIAEALLAGVLELVERDAVALWWYPRCRRPACDLTAWNDPRIEAAMAPQRALGTRFWVLDITTDLGIPAAVAVATGVGPQPETPLMGFGAHLDPALAVVRALTELAQMQAPISTLTSGVRVEFPGEAERTWFSTVTPETEPWLLPSGTVLPLASPAYADVRTALADVVARIGARGIDVWWADCTRPDIELPVVRTFAPGLRHFWNRFAPGRLYDVPPALGWCPPGYGETDLNPLAMIL